MKIVTATTILFIIATTLSAQTLKPFKNENGKWGYKNESGNEVISAKYDDAGNFSEGLAYVKLNKKYGYIDIKGDEITLLFEYDAAGDFSEGLAKVGKGGYLDRKWGFIDISGKVVIPIKYEDAGDFSNGEARVKLNGKTIYIDKTGSNEEERKKLKEEQAKKELEEKEAKAQKERQLITSLSRTDTSAKKVFDIYLEQDKLLFTKVNALNEFLRRSMPDWQNPILNEQWPAIALEMKKNYCKNAKIQLDSYRAKVKDIKLTKGQNELYDKINSHFETVEGFISSCDAWAAFISNRPVDAEDVDKQLGYLEANQEALKKSEVAIRLFIETYKKRNKL